MKKLLIITDSLGMPREEVLYEETWPFLLSKKNPHLHIIDKCLRAATTTRLIKEGGLGTDLLERYKPHFVIIQLGIVDCAPRLFSNRGLEHKLLKLMPRRIRYLYIKWIKMTRKRSIKRCYVSLDEFKTNVENYLNRSVKEHTHILFIEIAISVEYANFNPKTPHQVKKYNSALRELVKKHPFAHTLKIRDDNTFFLKDGYHLSPEGHVNLVQKIGLTENFKPNHS